jgi:hypothetical protein
MWKLRLDRIFTSLTTVERTCQDEHPEDDNNDWPKVNRNAVISLQEKANTDQDYYDTKYQGCNSSAVWKTKAFIFNPPVVFSIAPWIPFADGVEWSSAVCAIS